jgi:riboflavin transporter FmnP
MFLIVYWSRLRPKLFVSIVFWSRLRPKSQKGALVRTYKCIEALSQTTILDPVLLVDIILLEVYVLVPWYYTFILKNIEHFFSIFRISWISITSFSLISGLKFEEFTHRMDYNLPSGD